MKKEKRTIGVGCSDITAREKKYVMNTLKSNRLSYGPYSKKFESLFAKLHGVRYAIFVNSGTGALRIAVACLKEIHQWKENDEILCPAVTFVASANVIIMNGLKPVFVDVDEHTYNIDPQKIEEKITKRTKAIMAVHLFGQTAEMNPIMRIARKHNLKVIEDSCETMFVRHHRKPTGSFGDISCFSTYMAHLITTGVGGLACTKNAEYAEIMRSLANHGRDGIYLTIDDGRNVTGKKFEQIVARRFNFVRLGYSFRVTEMEAALGVAGLERRKSILAKRRKNARSLIEKLEHLSEFMQLPWWPNYSEHAFMMFPIVIKKGTKIKKKDLVMHLENYGIETRDMLPLINQPVYRERYGNIEKKYPVTEWINKNGFYIGCHQKVTETDCQYIAKTINAFFRARNLTART